MSQISEAGLSQMAGALRDGLEVLDANAEIEFQSYTRVVLPIDGFVFWQPKVKKTFKGSLHFSQEIQQNEDELLGLATVLFSSESQITEFATSLNTIWVARRGDFRYSFSQQQGFYTQAGLWHYFGHSIIPAFESQLLDTPGIIDPAQAVVSNSLPFWLALNTYVSPFYDQVQGSGVTLYPSYLTAPNIAPPYGSVQIGDGDTIPLQAIPYIDRDRNHYQLVSDTVNITLYGLQNNAAMDFVDFVLQYSRNTENFGIMNMPLIRDGKRPQTEMQALAMQKKITFTISYYQTRVAQVSRQLILDALPIDFIIGNLS
jgi:hypothetical protein